MRFIVAIVSFVLAFVMIGFGIAQRTVLAEPDRIVATAEVEGSAPIAVIDGSVLNAVDGLQRVTVGGEGNVFAAYGRTVDVEAWIGEAAHTRIGFDAEENALTTTLVRGAEETVPDPRGGDLWLDSFTAEDEVNFVINVPSDVSLLLLTDGTEPAPSAVSLSWPVDNRMPWATPLIIGGVILLLLGIALYIWALTHFNRSRGPRRKQPKLPKPPRRQRYKPGKLQPVAPQRGRRAAGRTAIIPAMAIGSLVLAGCTVSPESASLSAPATESAVPGEEAPSSPPIAVTPTQISRIMSRVSLVAAEADASRDAELAATRFSGPALELRSANYTIRGKDSGFAALAPIPTSETHIVLPQQTDTWPRTVFVVVEDVPLKTVPSTEQPPVGDDGAEGEGDAAAEDAEPEPKAAPLALMLVQQGPRDNFKVDYVVELAPGVVLPPLAAAEIGTARLRPDVKILRMPPAELATAYGDILLKGEESAHWSQFDMENDPLYDKIGKEAKAAIASELPNIAKIEFSNAPGDGEVIAMATDAGGAIVAVHVKADEVVTPVEEGATVSTSGTVKALAGVSSTTKGTAATYSDLVLFHVPATSSDEPIRLLGYAVQLIAARELS